MNKVLPNSKDAEQAILGAILIYPNATQAAIEYGLLVNHFFYDAHKSIFMTMLNLFNDNKTVDPTTLISKLSDNKLLTSIGGADYIMEIMDTATTSAGLKHYIDIVFDKFKMRQLIELTDVINLKAFDNINNVDDVLDEAERRILDVTRSRRSNDFRSADEIVATVLKNIKEKSEAGSAITGMKTGYSGLDRVTSGFQKGDLIILAARPSVGKTAFALNLGVQMALLNDLPTAIFSLEMPAESLMQRILTFKSEVAGTKLRDGTIKSNADWNALYEAANTIKDAKIFIDDSPMLKVSEIFSKCRKLKAEHNLGVIIIDYLQLMESSSNSESRQQAVSEISRAFKALARELDVPVIALSQLSRAVEQRTDKRPMLSDLRESGAIEQDADIVMFLYREMYHQNDEESDNEETDVIIAKHRNGSLATITLLFKKSINAFYSISRV